GRLSVQPGFWAAESMASCQQPVRYLSAQIRSGWPEMRGFSRQAAFLPSHTGRATRGKVAIVCATAKDLCHSAPLFYRRSVQVPRKPPGHQVRERVSQEEYALQDHSPPDG